MKKIGILLLLLSLSAGCVTSGDVQPLQTQEGRSKVRDAYVDLAKGYLREGMTSQAKQPLQKVLDMNARDSEALEIFGLVFWREVEPELAESYFKRALAIKRETRTLNNYASFLYDQKEYERAMELYTEAASDVMYHNRAGIFERMGQTALRLERDDAAQYFERAVRIDYFRETSLLELAVLKYQQKDYVTSQQFYDSYLEIADHNAKSLLLGTRLAKTFGDRNKAASLGLQLKKIYPASEEYLTYSKE